ncbi:hypothetical protein K3888_17430, partial [Dietzia aurantiaca]|uniref:hypothetical protein n=1 Tax=Dietzia aurantiaca TaxID=983873 RepID=UPI001E5134CC
LAQRLIDILDVLGLVAGASSQVGIGLDLTYANISIDRFRDTLSLEKLTDHPDAPELLRLLADQLEYERES